MARPDESCRPWPSNARLGPKFSIISREAFIRSMMRPHVGHLALVVGDVLAVGDRVELDPAVGAGLFAPCHLDIIDHALGGANAARVELMQRLGAPHIVFVLRIFPLPVKAVTVAVVVDRGREHAILAKALAALVGIGRLALIHDGIADIDAPAPLALVGCTSDRRGGRASGSSWPRSIRGRYPGSGRSRRLPSGCRSLRPCRGRSP